MEDLGLLLFLCFMIWMVIYAINLSTKKKTSEEEPTSEKLPTSEAAVPLKAEPAPVPQRPQKYTSIYEYVSTQNVIHCAVCDGENPHGSTICSICGNEIDG